MRQVQLRKACTNTLVFANKFTTLQLHCTDMKTYIMTLLLSNKCIKLRMYMNTAVTLAKRQMLANND